MSDTPEVKPQGIQRFLKANVTKKLKFCGDEVVIKKLTVGEVFAVQERVKASQSKGEESSFEVLFFILRTGSPEFDAYSDEELKELPIDELNKLSNEIMAFSGLGNK